MIKDSEALKALIEKAEKESKKLLAEVTEDKLDKCGLEDGLRQVVEDLIQIHVFNHKADGDDDPDANPK
jgi:hypothetical protein